MADLSIEELRRWAAGVCGYTVASCGCCYERGDTMQSIDGWLPDQNIAQAMELLGVLRQEGWLWVIKQMPDGMPFLLQGSRSEYEDSCPDQEIKGSKGQAVCQLSYMLNFEPGQRYRHDQYGFADKPALASVLASWKAKEGA